MTNSARPNSWRGIFPAICTPFAEDGSVDIEAQRRVVRFALKHGAHGLVVFGLAGEVLKLAGDERRQLIDAIIGEVEGRVPVLIGVTSESLPATLELARYAERAGASAVVATGPLSGALDGDAIVDYLVRVAAETSLPVMVQDAPAYLGVSLGPDTVKRAGLRAPNICLVKIEAGPSELAEWVATLGDGFGVWGGDGGAYLLDCLRVGAAGIVPGVDLVDLLVEVYEAEAAGDRDQSNEHFRRVLPVLVFAMQQSIDHYNQCAKLVLARRGVLEHTALRQPAAELPAVSRQLLAQHLDALDLDDVGSLAAS
jgi:dihydrodipicolinate synthase/N-acetylneuraminate lyase